MIKCFNVLLAIFISANCAIFANTTNSANVKIQSSENESSVEKQQDFKYIPLTGIGFEKGVSRRDPSDVIKALNGKYYVYYTKVPEFVKGAKNPLGTEGYYANIWYASSLDGYSWKEEGLAIGAGETGEFDSHAVFTPNILYYKGKYYLYYTGVKPTLDNTVGMFENNSINDFTAIGLTVSDSPDGPFKRVKNNPVLDIDPNREIFDSYRIDDAVLVVADKKIRLYYKGRNYADGKKGPRLTKMGVAMAKKPEGPYKKYENNPVLEKGHEVLIWHADGGFKAHASISSLELFSEDGLNFDQTGKGLKLVNRPLAPGLYRPHLTDSSIKEIPGWGISMKRKDGFIYLERFEMK